ncbi:hypothetical protein [Streptomyces sp. NPDC001388]|uniref:hypothetical protein n=1 Tax=Streptomyces sp. NPDC001388 TaxID=3364568 RepID=UPI0036842739
MPLRQPSGEPLGIRQGDGQPVAFARRFGEHQQRVGVRPVEEYLDLLGACRREIPAFRAAFTELLEGCTADVEPYEQEEEDRVRDLLRRLAPVAVPGQCLVCIQPCPASGRPPREFCSAWCRGRAKVLHNRGLLPDGAEMVSLTPRSSR